MSKCRLSCKLGLDPHLVLPFEWGSVALLPSCAYPLRLTFVLAVCHCHFVPVSFFALPVQPCTAVFLAAHCLVSMCCNSSQLPCFSLRVSCSACSFNAGVYVADMDRWRAANVTSDLLYWLELNTRCVFSAYHLVETIN